MTYSLAEEPEPHPDSPPDLGYGSKSSKSSSFHSSYHSDDNADISNFEEIGLDDEPQHSSGDFSLRPAATLPIMNPHSSNYATELRSRTLAGKKSMPSLSTSASKRRDLTSLKTRQSPNHYMSPNTAPVDMSNRRPSPLRSNSFEPPIMRRGFTSPSSMTLSTGSRTPRSRTPSPNTITPDGVRSRSTSTHSLPRTAGWQYGKEKARKSTAELELECDEDDDDNVPDGFFLENVPISPRPPGLRAPSISKSKEPSPERPRQRKETPRKEKSKAIGNGTPAHSVAQGSLRSPLASPGIPQPGGISMAQFPINNDNARPIARPRSWDDAMANLSPETQALTEKLEEHATEVERMPPSPQHRRSFNVASTRPKMANKTRIKSTPELPPLRRTNIMIDPLPVSKEKEAVLSRTRPSWLPPKDPAEEKRHVKEYQKMMAMSVASEKRREEYQAAKVTLKEDTAGALGRIWEEIVIPDWDKTMRHRRTRELWWRGIGPRSRGKVWSRAIGNELGLTEGSYNAALSRAMEMEKRVQTLIAKAEKDGHDNAGLSAEELRMKIGFEKIIKDIDATYPELCLFRSAAAGVHNAASVTQGPLHSQLRNILYAYSAYRGDVGYIPGTNGIAALLLLNLPSPASAFISLCNILNRPLPLSFHTGDLSATQRVYDLTISTLSVKYPRLHNHLQSVALDPTAYLEPMFRCLLTNSLPLEEATRLWDVVVFEGDAILVRAVVAILGSLEVELFGVRDRQYICDIISRGLQKSGQNADSPVSIDSDEFMRRVRDAGRDGSA